VRFRLWFGTRSVELLASTRVKAWTGGFAVRRDWPDGTHDFFGLSPNLALVLRRLARDERFWRRGPLRPVGRTVVWMRGDTFRLHPRWCRGSRCVGGMTARAVSAGGTEVRR
jgi:hypothetical protein